MNNIDDDSGTTYLMDDEIIISRDKYEQLQNALWLCSLISTLNRPAFQKITMQQLIDKAKAVCKRR